MRRLITPLLLLALGATACSDKKASPAGPTPIEEEEFVPALNVELDAMTRTASGLYYQDLVVGEGERTAAVGDVVTVFYSGWLVNGKRFDSNEGGKPFEVNTLGAGKVIGGWDEGLQGMAVGGTRKLVIPSHLGYGARGAGRDIPPNATLVFEVVVVGIEKRQDLENGD